MGLVHVDERKWPDRLHGQYDARLLGEDEPGIWLHARSDTVVERGSEPSRPLGIGFVGLVPRDEWWIVEFYAHHPWLAVYVNIGTPPVWNGNWVTQIDLDLDVVRKMDDTVEVLDEDEFAEHQDMYSSPSHIIAAARAATDTAVEHAMPLE
jgi:protein associated with RNAse G/E